MHQLSGRLRQKELRLSRTGERRDRRDLERYDQQWAQTPARPAQREQMGREAQRREQLVEPRAVQTICTSVRELAMQAEITE